MMNEMNDAFHFTILEEKIDREVEERMKTIDIENPSKDIKLRYDLIDAHFSGIRVHPQKDMEDMGYTWTKSEPVPIADCWFFWVDAVIGELPEYLTICEGWQ